MQNKTLIVVQQSTYVQISTLLIIITDIMYMHAIRDIVPWL